MAAETVCVQKLAEYDYVQFVVPDINNIPRGKVFKGKFKEKVAKEGYEIGNVICMPGTNYGYAIPIFGIIGKHLPNVDMRPCLDTLTPWPWAEHKGRRVGNVLCDVYQHDGTPDLTSPRQVLKAQIDALHDKHGLVVKSAFEYEFCVFKEGTLEPLGGDDYWPYDVRIWGLNQDLFHDLTDALEVMGVEVSSIMPEYWSGQWEITTEPHEGIRGGDVAFYVKHAVKGVLQSHGYNGTFMAKPTSGYVTTGMHLNHSLWTADGTSAMLDETDPDRMSKMARHWVAGLLTHAPAINALCCPTVNCYRRLYGVACPGKISWGLDDRSALVRVHTARDNVFLENRLPSGACNPYLGLAATLAAGLDGLNRKLECPAPGDVTDELPKTLSLALDALEKDVELRSLLGSRFVDCYVITKRGCDVKRFEDAMLSGEEKELEHERKMYMVDF